MIKAIVTHSGKFHADEVFGVATLFGIFGKIPLYRTRDKTKIDEAVNSGGIAILDVGGTLNPRKLQFDHHQSDFDIESFSNSNAEVGKNKYEYRYVLYTKAFFEALSGIGYPIDENDRNKVCQSLRKTFGEISDVNERNYMSLYAYVTRTLEKDLEIVLSEVSEMGNKGKIRLSANSLRVFLTERKNSARILSLMKNSFFSHYGYRRYATAGLVWETFGMDYVRTKFGFKHFTEERLSYLKSYVDKKILRYVDNIDNGIAYQIPDFSKGYDVSELIGSFNDTDVSDYDTQLEGFLKAVDIASSLLDNELRREIDVIESTDRFVYEYVPGKPVQKFSKFIPKIEKMLYEAKDYDTMFHVYPFRNDDGMVKWRIGSISTNGFESRMLLPEYWLEKDSEGKNIVPGLNFCHSGRFVAEFETSDDMEAELDKMFRQ